MRSFAPMLGFALGAWTNSLYVNLTGNFADFFPSFENGEYCFWEKGATSQQHEWR